MPGSQSNIVLFLLYLIQLGAKQWLKGVKTWSIIDAFSEFCSPFLKGGNFAIFIAWIASATFYKNK